MPYFNTCPICGANLDPGEHCDCEDAEQAKKKIDKEKVRHE